MGYWKWVYEGMQWVVEMALEEKPFLYYVVYAFGMAGIIYFFSEIVFDIHLTHSIWFWFTGTFWLISSLLVLSYARYREEHKDD